jgi:hypothetical protein
MTMRVAIDLNKNLDELEGVAWGKPTFNSSLVLRCHELRKRPLGKMSVEDLRLLIGQQIGLQFLVPLALDHLQADPLVAGERYRGDLLVAILGIDHRFWFEHDDLYWVLREALVEVEGIFELIGAEMGRLKALLDLKGEVPA